MQMHYEWFTTESAAGVHAVCERLLQKANDAMQLVFAFRHSKPEKIEYLCSVDRLIAELRKVCVPCPTRGIKHHHTDECTGKRCMLTASAFI